MKISEKINTIMSRRKAQRKCEVSISHWTREKNADFPTFENGLTIEKGKRCWKI